MKTMKAAILTKQNTMEIQEIPIPECGDDEVLVKVMAVGVCGSDVHFFSEGHIGDDYVQYPHILGHEGAGIVEAVGKNVTKFQPGDHVAVEPGIACGFCPACKAGKYNLCEKMQFMSGPPVWGCLRQYLTIREDFCFQIPMDMSFERGSLVEPLSVAIHAVRQARVKPNDRVLIVGAGPIGLSCIAAVKDCGAGEVMICDTIPQRLEMARQFGARVFDVSKVPIQEQLADEIAADQIDVGMETAGIVSGFGTLIDCVKRGGSIVLVGCPSADTAPIPIGKLVTKELMVNGLFRYRNTYPYGIHLAASDVAPFDLMFTQSFPLADAQKAHEMARDDKANCMKIIIHPNE
ncbi:NAD(P)-dependent alcohol dehydrogenase [Zongyangia hominis]|uniref:NAD(P)-dependent alcohol dehydrogenase n=1 Tax=Zongyangia hominis TaxID=2763677 RepID=A0A926EA68_9FIRM|nr:NAD(P)-dependent alcohol dehydrogenase [Zongyangia hominis]MBC8570755.1 NAD(P)-dependent alcohol dehydrogenase [Zongyangia hominis]